ncbi:MAG TPA: PHP domain-containing protein [Acidimicrobiales bacterium]|nr:PHP domain-containing protein [Acidimicrobiales bacterium]
MLDYHLHLWPHGERHRTPTLEELAAYCEAAQAEGIEEIALTEHLFRFAQADGPLSGHWSDADDDPRLEQQAADYWREHNGADLDEYVETVLEAKAAGLPVVLGLEVDFYPHRMDKVRSLLEGYPFDVLLGSVHWIGAWLFDVLESAVAQDEWSNRGVDHAWDAYVRALEELAGTGVVDVLAHPDLCKVAARWPSSGSFVDECHDRIADAAARAGIAAEVSSAGWRKPCDEAYPAPSLLTKFRARGVPITTASDAHSLDLVAYRAADLRPYVVAAGYDEVVAFRRRQPHRLPLAGA